MATRLARRTGATVRMAMAIASCAVTAALSGAHKRCDLAVDIKFCGSLTTRLHTPGVSTWRINAVFLSVRPPRRRSSRSRRISSRRAQAASSMHLVSLAKATNLQAKSIVKAVGVSPFLAQYASRIFSTTSGDSSADNELRSPIGTPVLHDCQALLVYV